MSVVALNNLVQSVYDELVIDIAPKEAGLDALLIKTNNAYREVKHTRNYPAAAEDTFVETDMGQFFKVIYDLAMYDYNMRGAEGQSRISENGEERTFVKRETLLKPVLPFAYFA